jgi:hypothetical protein
MTVNVLALIYGVTAIVILSVYSPASGEDFISRWLVPILAGIVFLIGLAWLLIVKPTVNIQEEDRAGAAAADMPAVSPQQEDAAAETATA